MGVPCRKPIWIIIKQWIGIYNINVVLVILVKILFGFALNDYKALVNLYSDTEKLLRYPDWCNLKNE